MACPFLETQSLDTHRLACHEGSSDPHVAVNDGTRITYLPGNPAVSLRPGDVVAYITRELQTPLLDNLYPQLWWVARKCGESISALHVQRIRGREIVPCEDPRLHLMWKYDRVFIKPLPSYLLNHSVWTEYLSCPCENDEGASHSPFGGYSPKDLTRPYIRSIALGFVRSYSLLIQHHADFVLAKESHLIPTNIEWIQWQIFINNFRCLGDEVVAKRYHYGQLRLSRLDWAVRIFRPATAETFWFYQIPDWSVTRYLSKANYPILFLFANISLALSSMQVALSVPSEILVSRGFGMRGAGQVFWFFAICIIMFTVLIWILYLFIPFAVLLWQLSWGYRHRRGVRTNRTSLNI
jgi:hypothetical protein